MTTAATAASDHKRTLFRTLQFIEKLRELFPDTPMQTVSVFLIIAMKPGICQRDLLKLLDISQSGVSRNVMALGKVNRHGNPGLGLIVQQCDRLDARQVHLRLTPAGKQLVNQLLSIGREA